MKENHKEIETAILKEIMFKNKDKEIKLQCFKDNTAIKFYIKNQNKKQMKAKHIIF